MRVPIPNFMLDVINANSGLKAYLESLLEDKAYTQRSWLYDGQSGNPFLTTSAVLSEWLKQLKTLENGSDFEKNVYQFDTSQIEKWGPQGGHEPIEELMDNVVLPTFGHGDAISDPPIFKTPAWQLAVDDVIEEFHHYGVRNLSPRAYDRVVDDMRVRDTLESNSGYPDFTRRSNPDVRARAIADAQSGAWREYPAIALFRRYNAKTRLVWMFPFATNVVEGSWFQPLSDAIMHSTHFANEFFSPWKGFEQVRARITQFYRNGYQIAASDFTSTDAHFQLATSREVLKVLVALFKPSFADALTESIEAMHKIPLLIGPKYMLTGDHGVSSGSNWTNFIETIFDMILSKYVWICSAGVITSGTPWVAYWKDPSTSNAHGLYAIGDDCAWYTYDSFSTDKGKLLFKKSLDATGKGVGQLIKADKTMAEPNQVKTLQRLFQRGYIRDDGQLRGVYSTVRALKSSVFPERFHFDWSSDYFCDRQFQILENCVDHPLFYEFVRFVCKGNRHLIPFAKLKDGVLEQIHGRAKLVPGLVGTYNQEKRDENLSQFESIRIAREL